MKRYPAGSEWRKWDLHIHVPGNTQTDKFEPKDGSPDWDRFADMLENSDVAVFGITDYFSPTSVLGFIAHFKARFPKSAKMLLANIELRLNETVNGNVQMVDFHIVFRDTLADDKIREFLSNLKTQISDENRRKKSCMELSTTTDFETASVTRTAIDEAFRSTFGDAAEPTNYLIYLAPANNNGLRAESGNRRKGLLADEIDKTVHAIFAKTTDTPNYYLQTDRYDDKKQTSKAKPVFGGCDAHSFDEVSDWLGKTVDPNGKDSTHQVITWVKADPTFEGLQQTLVEPEDRVRIGPLMPDAKDAYKVIKTVRFRGSADFPEEIALNPNLNAIVGSRSSGKSALLAHIAHAVDPEYTIRQQVLASGSDETQVGPAAGHSWKSVADTICEIEWSDGKVGGGNVLYVPQNWLYQISDKPNEVTAKIRPILETQYGQYFREHERLLAAANTSNESISRHVVSWFDNSDELKRLKDEIKSIGDKDSIVKARDKYQGHIEAIRKDNALSAEDLEEFQRVVNEIDDRKSRLSEIKIEIDQIAPYVKKRKSGNFKVVSQAISVETYLEPEISSLPEALAQPIAEATLKAQAGLTKKVGEAILAHRLALAEEHETCLAAKKALEEDNKLLLEKHRANTALDELVKRQKAQQKSLDAIEKLEKKVTALLDSRKTNEEQIAAELDSRVLSLKSLTTEFKSKPRGLYGLTFGIELGFADETIRLLSEPFRKREIGPYLKKNSSSEALVDIEKAQENPSSFMTDLLNGVQKLNQGASTTEVAKRTLTATPELRFTAELDQDQIGGFTRSTMTPGKQALFALTLILGEAEDRWALLIDQPEDDLDSRSIYKEIVSYLVAQKKHRQIVLVTHNANLVVGADAEEVIVANRHGVDRKNKDGQRFDYLTGSLEHSSPFNKNAKFELEKMGIREHAVDILDGGEIAFQKRRDKYKL